LRCAAQRTLCRTHQQLAAFIIEPLVQGLRHACTTGVSNRACNYRRIRVHLIAMNCGGMGPQVRCLPVNRVKITPDFLCLSKGITRYSLSV